MRRRGGSLSLKQVLSIIAAFLVIYLVSAHHKALTAWFAAPAKGPKAEGAKEVRGTQ